ncbi:MAG: family 43 glycosylhydrolase [Ruminococcus sp.]|nr:family 43 glycosylhydrolase [Ruminococcus sp.]
MSKKQSFNPYLPSYEYVPDGEPHVFGDRVYIYGSHDRFDGADFCLNDYVSYSADVHDLTDWRYEGVIYRGMQDPRNQNVPANAPEAKPGFCAKADFEPKDLNAPGICPMFAPDVVCGPDGRYYLYYCLDPYSETCVAVCDTPAGAYEYLGMVKYADGTILGRREGDYTTFDPGVFVDDDGEIYLYVGNGPIRPEQEDGTKHSVVMSLEPDMLTIKGGPKKLMPSVTESEGTGYAGHEFFEASSIRKVGGKYYFVYSSINSHELCYAVSDKPDEGYEYGGTLVDIGDVYLDGRDAKDAVNCLGNTHGGMECIDGQWYIFYHRQSNRTNYSRQGCAEKIYFDEDGRIGQVEVTSCGMNKGALEGKGTYPAYICCALRAKQGTTFAHPLAMQMNFPYLTQDGGDVEPEDERARTDSETPVQYIKNMTDGSVAGYKYFKFEDTKSITLTVRGEAKGSVEVVAVPKGITITERYADMQGMVCGSVEIEIGGNAGVEDTGNWTNVSGAVQFPAGECALYLRYVGEGSLDLLKFTI